MMVSQSSTKLKAIRIVFGINILGLMFLGLTITADVFRFDLPGFRIHTLQIHYFSESSNIPFQPESLHPVTILNITETTIFIHDQYRNRTRGTIRNVAFLKVHKAGSTTMQNLFFRFGIRHNLNVLLPKKGNYMFNMRQAIPIKPPHTYNLFACHTRYSKPFFDSLIPTGSVNIGIVREPIDRMISAAYYYRDVWGVPYLKKIPQANFIHNLIGQQYRYDTSFYSRTRNSMGNDFGFQKGIKSSETKKIQSYLESLNSDFLLVMVVEKFDESLVMMKRLLSWSFLDIIYLKTNSHQHKPVVLNKDEEDNVRKVNFLDFAIYEYFTEIFDKKLQSMEDDFDGEVTFFREILSKVFTFCSDKNVKDDTKLFINESRWDDEFNVLGVECRWMNTGELSFINDLRSKGHLNR
ncbi:galactose-3-O-sulfotransferase 1 [Mactra antiquata]